MPLNDSKIAVLHQEHESDAWHEPPVKLTDQLLVQSGHLLLAQMSKCLKTGLDLLRSVVVTFNRHFLELDVSLLLVGRDVCHGEDEL